MERATTATRKDIKLPTVLNVIESRMDLNKTTTNFEAVLTTETTTLAEMEIIV